MADKVDPTKLALLEELAARAVSRGERDDPLTVRLQALILELKGPPAPAPGPAKPPERKPVEG